LALVAALELGAGACLPGDQRPPPGVVSVWLEGAEGLEGRVPLLTDDGWSITFERVLVASSGVIEQSDDDATNADGSLVCEIYYDTSMRAIYDLVVPGARPLGHVAGLGDCRFDTRWGRFGFAADVLGPGVSLDDIQTIIAKLQGSGVRGVPTLYVAGTASQGARQKTFAWPFSPRGIFGGCGQGRGVLAFRRQLDASAAFDATVTVHPSWLFADMAYSSTARLRFDPLADADDRGDGNGEVTRAELEKRPLLALTEASGAYAMPLDGPPLIDADGAARAPTLLDFVGLQVGHLFYNDEIDPCSIAAPAE
jgi:hypothetical protein